MDLSTHVYRYVRANDHAHAYACVDTYQPQPDQAHTERCSRHTPLAERLKLRTCAGKCAETHIRTYEQTCSTMCMCVNTPRLKPHTWTFKDVGTVMIMIVIAHCFESP